MNKQKTFTLGLTAFLLLALNNVQAQKKTTIMKHNISNNAGLESFSLFNVAFTVTDLDKSINWYSNVFGFKLLSRSTFKIPAGDAEAAIIEGNGLKLELLHVPDGQRIEALFAAPPAHLVPIGNKSLVLQVDDLAQASRELEAKGVEFVWREQNLIEGQMLCSMIKDIDGNKINIFQTNTTFGPNVAPVKAVDPSILTNAHIAIWSEYDSQKRKVLIDKLYSTDFRLTDPNGIVVGRDALNEFITELLAKYPGYTFTVDGSIETHHNVIKFNWNFGPKDNPAKIKGTDVLITQTGSINSLLVFIK
ncbi:VOC family protein [[Flexibacter] sp. ATCC 35103]|uniref:VOC family protein n=1 Tax=[Flexibacter] sp. ATCC 35103 TaxID=1937528 RepID=UPI0009C75621|nr:VOC family protein [[Flexibacter] sp. ATCC 35103]OMQ07986.1 hypothetical protein BXU01_22715 [[Flexibacter] sp. ATCC 35103]